MGGACAPGRHSYVVLPQHSHAGAGSKSGPVLDLQLDRVSPTKTKALGGLLEAALWNPRASFASECRDQGALGLEGQWLKNWVAVKELK